MRRPARFTWLLLAATVLAACTQDTDPPRSDPTPVVAPTAPGRAVPTYEPPPLVTEPAAGWKEASCSLPEDELRRIRQGYYRGRSPEVLYVPRYPNFYGGFTSTTHSGPWDYVQEVPLVFYGPGHIQERGEIELDRLSTVADIAPTIAALLDTPFPAGRPGVAVTEAIVDAPAPPKVILTVVWDGGGWNVLNTWPDAWPFLGKMMREGTSVAGVEVGSSPSVTPAIHATIGTGTFPRHHGIIDIPMRDGGDIVGAYDGFTPRYLEVPSIADLWDRRNDNEALIGMFAYKSWHLGMIGHGAYVPGGDHDIAVVSERTQGDLKTNPDWYSLPPYLNDLPGFEDDRRRVDLDDGKLDDRWMGHEVLNDGNKLRHTPVWALYQTRLLKAIFENEGFGADDIADLFFVNYKQIDDVGHDWNMLNPEMREIIEYSDTELRKLVRFLDDTVGRNEWVMVVTADHGQAPDPVASYAWPIRIQLLQADIGEHFGVDPAELFQDERPVGFWLDPEVAATHGITAEDVSDFLIDYRLKDNMRDGEDVPEHYLTRLDEPLFAAAFPSERIGEVWHCVRHNG